MDRGGEIERETGREREYLSKGLKFKSFAEMIFKPFYAM